MLQDFNIFVFSLINAPLDSAPWKIEVARFLAEAPQYFLGAAIIYVLVKTPRKAVYHFSMLALTTLIALSISKLLSHSFPMDRPFAMGLGNQWMDHRADGSFPSDHATFLFAIAGASIWFTSQQWLARFAFFLGILNGWARVNVGIHFPLDILGAMFVGYFAGSLCMLGQWAFQSLQKTKHVSA